MQFIPSTWMIYGADGNGDGIKDPFNIFDAALAAANYLCDAGGDLSTTGRADPGRAHLQPLVRLPGRGARTRAHLRQR